MYSSEKSAQKRSIMDYLPEQQKAKIRKLVERLAEQTQEKEKFKRLYEQMKKKYQEVSNKCSELEQCNNDLRTQIATSRMAINKAKEAYQASKSAKKIRKNEKEDSGENEAIPSSHLKQLWSKIPKSGQVKQQKNQYVFEQGENENNINIYQKTTSKRAFETPGVDSKKNMRIQKSKQPVLQTNTSLENLNAYSNNKKQQILNLRKQIENLTQEMKRKSNSNLPLNDKIQKCQEIKRRYLKSKQKMRRNEESDSEKQSQEDLRGGKKFLEVGADVDESKIREKDLEKQLSETLKEKQREKIEKARYKQNVRKQHLEQQYIGQNSDSKYSKTHSRNTSNPNSQLTNKIRKDRSKKQQDSGTSRNKTSLDQLSQYRYNKQPRSPYQHQRGSEDNQRNVPEKNKRQLKKGQFQSKFDDSLFAIIDQLNSGP